MSGQHEAGGDGYAPTEAKVTAAATTAALVTLLMWGLSFVPFVDDMPTAVAGALLVLVTGAVTYAVGWLAPHTPRALPDLPIEAQPNAATEGTGNGDEYPQGGTNPPGFIP